jgi:hypothetical protein
MTFKVSVYDVGFALGAILVFVGLCCFAWPLALAAAGGGLVKLGLIGARWEARRGRQQSTSGNSGGRVFSVGPEDANLGDDDDED